MITGAAIDFSKVVFTKCLKPHPVERGAQRTFTFLGVLFTRTTGARDLARAPDSARDVGRTQLHHDHVAITPKDHVRAF